MATKKTTKKKAPAKRKATRRKAPAKKPQEVVLRVQTEPVVKDKDLMPIQGDGSNKYSVAKTWMSEKQIMHMLQKTPGQHVHQREGRGGMKFDYVTGVYVKKVLNYVFGWNWNFEIVSEEVHGDQIVVRGRLTVMGPNDQKVIKEQYGGAEIKRLKDSRKPMDIGNDFKSAATDALKKCASELGFASDVYGKNEFKDIGRPVEEKPKPVEQIIKEEKAMGIPCQGYDKTGCPGKIRLSHAQADFSRKVHKRMMCSTCQETFKNKK